LAVLRSAGLVAERKQANHVLYSLVPEHLKASVGAFLAAVAPDRPEQGRSGRKRTKPTDKRPTKKKRKGPAGGRGPEQVERSQADHGEAQLGPATDGINARA
jgi:hypothetical protein